MNEFMAFTDWSWSLGLLGLVVAGFIYGYVKKQPSGTDVMRDLEQQIHDGSMAFLRREYTVLAVFVAIVAVLLGFAFATTIPIVQVLLTGVAPADRRGAVMSLNGTVLRLGQTLGPPVMALVHRTAGIDAVFFVSAVFALVLALLMTWAVRLPPPAQ